MTGTSHAITGAFVAVVVGEPVLALPLAFLSHFVCDMIPHIGTADVKDPVHKKRRAGRIYIIDLTLILCFFGLLFFLGAPWYVVAGAFLAGSPDFVWFYRYIIKEKLKHIDPGKMNIFSRTHSQIQWSETLKYGLPVEIVYSCVLLFLTVKHL